MLLVSLQYRGERVKQDFTFEYKDLEDELRVWSQKSSIGNSNHIEDEEVEGREILDIYFRIKTTRHQ